MGIFRGCGVEIKLIEDSNTFLKIKETLTRIGVTPSSDSKTLYQSCHILHKTDPITKVSRYSILHFKEMFLLDGKYSTIDKADLYRRNAIINLLAQWGLIEEVKNLETDRVKLKIIPYSKKEEWRLVPKYHIGWKPN